MENVVETDKGFLSPQSNLNNADAGTSCFCFDAFEERMSQRLSAVKAQNLCHCVEGDILASAAAKLSKKII